MALLSDPDPDSKLCALLLFFPLKETSHAHPHHLLAEPSWELKSHWLGGTPGRLWENLLCLHASRENPNNNCYLGQPYNLQLSRQDTQRCKHKIHTHGSWGNQVSKIRPNDESLLSLILCFMLGMTKYTVWTCIFLVGTVFNHVVSFSGENFQSQYGHTFYNIWEHTTLKAQLASSCNRKKCLDSSVDVLPCLCFVIRQDHMSWYWPKSNSRSWNAQRLYTST